MSTAWYEPGTPQPSLRALLRDFWRFTVWFVLGERLSRRFIKPG